MTLMRTLTASVLAISAALPAMAEQITLNVLYNLPGFTRFHQPLADEFMANNPDIKINFLAPAAGYNEGHQQVLRAAVTNDMPDVFFSGYHLLEELATTLAARDQITDLAPMIQAEGGQAWLDESFAAPMVALGEVGGV
ncbi:MAG: extracellular solute-binding protein, partial [Paracoccus sp. (in: a-proteobacteria)]|nr:extracellular solute-binding protein [Paracoccus sp. (in: a-proteobacteria)]